jgi:hypothetical protein
MRFPIDVVFLDRRLRIIGLLQHMAPWRFAFARAGTRLVLELQAGRIAELGLMPGIDLCACFDDEDDEEIVPGIRSRVRDSTMHPRPRPSSPCIAFSLRLPLRDDMRIDYRDACAHAEPFVQQTTSADSAECVKHPRL